MVAIALSRGTTPGPGPVDDETQPVTVRGDALDGFGPDDDPAVGLPAPELIGRDLDGEEIRISSDGRPKAITFLAHWCPHCQNEVRDLVAWLEDNDLPESVDLYTVSTLVERARGNYPPSSWLEREGWPFPVLADDAVASAADAFGLSGTPFWVFIDADGMVVARRSGELGADQLSRILEDLARA